MPCADAAISPHNVSGSPQSPLQNPNGLVQASEADREAKQMELPNKGQYPQITAAFHYKYETG